MWTQDPGKGLSYVTVGCHDFKHLTHPKTVQNIFSQEQNQNIKEVFWWILILTYKLDFSLSILIRF